MPSGQVPSQLPVALMTEVYNIMPHGSRAVERSVVGIDKNGQIMR